MTDHVNSDNETFVRKQIPYRKPSFCCLLLHPFYLIKCVKRNQFFNFFFLVKTLTFLYHQHFDNFCKFVSIASCNRLNIVSYYHLVNWKLTRIKTMRQMYTASEVGSKKMSLSFLIDQLHFFLFYCLWNISV